MDTLETQVAVIMTKLEAMHNDFRKHEIQNNKVIESLTDQVKETNGKVRTAAGWIKNFDDEKYKDKIKENSISRMKFVTMITSIMFVFSVGGFTLVKATADNYFDNKIKNITAQIVENTTKAVLLELENGSFNFIE
jgi:uncharacterized protein YqhQ